MRAHACTIACTIACLCLVLSLQATAEGFLLGNGGLALGVDHTGWIAVCRWPGPGAANQFRLNPAGKSPARDPRGGGAGWEIRVDGVTVWPSHDPWTVETKYTGSGRAIVETTLTQPGTPIRIVERVCVDCGKSCFTSTIHIHGIDTPPECLWYAFPMPSTTAGRGPVWVAPREGQSGFARFLLPADGLSVCFRPQHPGSQERERVRDSIEKYRVSGQLKEWESFGKGTWIVSTAVGPAQDAWYVPNTGDPETSDRNARNGYPATEDAVASAIAVEAQPIDNGFSAEMITGFGEEFSEALHICREGRQTGTSVIEQESEEFWTSWITKANLPRTANEETADLLRDDLVRMARSVDANTGATLTTVRGPGSRAVATPIDSPRDEIRTALAWELASFPDRADKQAAFYDNAMRRVDTPGHPAGSWPYLLDGNGTSALPDWIFDPGTSAWVLALFHRHAKGLPEPERAPFVRQHWDCIEQATDFVTGWMDARNREPLAGFDEVHWRNGTNDTMFLEHFMGVDAGLRLATLAGNVPNEAWTRRKRELEALIRFHCVAKGGQWTSSATLPFWQEEFRETGLPSWEKTIEQRLFSPEKGDNPSEKDICDAALAFRGKADKLNALKPLVPAPPCTKDVSAYSSALHFITISLIYGETK